MAAPKERYPSLLQLRNMSNQEIFDRKLTGMSPAQAGQLR